MNKIRLDATVAIFFSMIGLLSCDNECDSTKATTAEFLIYEELQYARENEKGKIETVVNKIEEDTFLVNHHVTFEAVDAGGSSYDWKIGSDTRLRTEKKITITFDDPSVVYENPLRVRLKVTKDPNNDCFPDDDGIDSVEHFIYFLPLDEWPLYGTYLGSDNTDPNSKYLIEITQEKTLSDPALMPVIKYLPANCNNSKAALIGYASTYFFTIERFDIAGAVPPLQCLFRQYDTKEGHLLEDRKTIVIDYEFSDASEQDNTVQRRTFTGIRQ